MSAAPERFELCIDDSGYPEQLRNCERPPRRLYGIGDPATLTAGIAIVGARRATPYGLRAATLFAGWAASTGIVVVSGGAVGCDQAAHRAALQNGGATVAVLGCGADVVYPRGSSCLLDSIARHGAVVSELPWGTPPQRFTFVERNRIIAGLSKVVLVVEASLPSGTFSTADFALNSGRGVCAVPGPIFAPECRGSNRLIAQGATPIADVSELARELQLAFSEQQLSDPDTWTWQGADSPVARALRTCPQRPDDLARDLGEDVVSVAREIGRLENRGLVVRYRDGKYGWK